ncbi:hypothetical protein ACVINY_002483 [Sinorhizobium meliloti]
MSELVIPARLFDFPADGGLVGVRSQEVEAAQEGNVLRAVVLAVSGGVLAEVDIQNPMQFVFDLQWVLTTSISALGAFHSSL